MPGHPVLSRLRRHFTKTVTFDGGSGSGAVGTVAIATITGSVLLEHLTCECTTLLAGATATLELGTANNTAALIAQTTATEIDANEYWHDDTPEAEVGDAVTNKTVNANIILTVGTAAISSGVIVISGFWVPLSAPGRLALA